MRTVQHPSGALQPLAADLPVPEGWVEIDTVEPDLDELVLLACLYAPLIIYVATGSFW
jgi:hypothetical protein